MNKLPRYWKPLRRVYEFHPPRPELIEETIKFYGIDRAAALAMLERAHNTSEYWVNDLFQVAVSKCGPDNSMSQINIRRLDGSHDLRDWRHFQQIKNETTDPEREGFELYPAESRKVDTANKFHIWVLPEGVTMNVVGWMKRDINYQENRDVPGMRQRPL